MQIVRPAVNKTGSGLNEELSSALVSRGFVISKERACLSCLKPHKSRLPCCEKRMENRDQAIKKFFVKNMSIVHQESRGAAVGNEN
jgi:hypothetical protein